MDADLAPAKIYRIFSDPDRPFGQAPAPHGIPPVSTYLKVTIYVSPDDRALAGSSWLSGSLVRLDSRCSARTTWSKCALRACPMSSGDRNNGFPRPRLLRLQSARGREYRRDAALWTQAQRSWPPAGRALETLLARARGRPAVGIAFRQIARTTRNTRVASLSIIGS